MALIVVLYLCFLDYSDSFQWVSPIVSEQYEATFIGMAIFFQELFWDVVSLR